jgi:nucleoside phosphorylase
LAIQATVAVLTALPAEQAAMELMLDSPVQYSTPGNAPGEYWLGTVPSKDGREHCVVLGRCAVGENLAAANATILFERFPRIETVIMVGIAGAVPDPSKLEADVRLGDIVVCNSDGVIQYDYEKELRKAGKVTTESRHPPRPPSARLAAAAEELRSGALLNRRPWEEHFARADGHSWAQRPTSSDDLHSHLAPHEVLERLVDLDRARGMPRVFSGRIASGNKLLKDAKLRERLRSTFGVRAVEMEASGVADASWLQRAGYFVVRGTCDYCDDHKNDEWQGYAAMIAAAYTRALLGQTRAMTPPDGGLKAIEDATDPLASLPRELRDAFVASTAALGNGSAELNTALGELVAAETQSREQFDAAWPSDRPWADSVAGGLKAVVSSYQTDLKPGELLLAAAMPYFVSAVQKSTIRAAFGPDRDAAASDKAYRELFASSPTVEALLGRDLPETSTRFVFRWAMLRLASEQRPSWSDAQFRTHSPDVVFARWLAADPLVPTLARVVSGKVEQFESLPENGTFRFGQRTFEIRWRLLACLLSLAELRVVGAHLLSPDVVEHIAQLSDVQKAVEEQFQRLTIESDADRALVLRATCDEPVLDHAITEIAGHLDKELRTHRAKMSNYLAVSLRTHGFPAVRGEPHARVSEGRPRYTTPHVTFAMAPEHARRLFMGSDLWGDPSFAFRELFQNALDACRYRAARSQFLGMPYVPLIRMFHGRAADGREYVECEDNGIGMDRNVVASCFAMAGRRFINTEEFRREKEAWRERSIEVHTNSQFGIGVFSYFLLAEELEVETARLGPSGETPTARLSLRVPTAAAFFRIVTLSGEEARAGQRQRAQEREDTTSSFLDAGTRVRLWLRRDRDDASEVRKARVSCVDAIREHVWFSEVAVAVRDFHGQRYEISANQLAPWISHAVEAAGDEPQFWWVVEPIQERPDGGQHAEAVTTFRSRKRGNGDGPGVYDRPGRVLVDGIATDTTTPGFIVNLTGDRTPQLSLDRRKIRSDIREELERRVDRAIPHLPNDVSESFLQDLWHWDPRACHTATRLLDERKVGWFRDRGYRNLAKKKGAPERTLEPYMPRISGNQWSSAERSDYRNKLLSLWRLARRMPDAQQQSAVVLEARGVASEFQRYLAHIPKQIWDAWGSTDLAVPEACAMLYGSSDENPLALPAFMSWLTGETIAAGSQRMVALRELLDLEWTPSDAAHEFAVSDYDAWLLGRGQFSPPWAGPTITTSDVLVFSRNTGKSLDDAFNDYVSLAKRLGWTVSFDRELAESVGFMSQHEATHLKMLEMGWAGVWRTESMSSEREAVLAKVAGVNPPKEARPRPLPRHEQEKVLFDLTSRATERTGELILAGLCEVARSIERPVAEVAADVRAVAEALQIRCSWTDDALTAVSGFSEEDWSIAEDTTGWLTSRKRVLPRTKIKLAALLAAQSYSFSGGAKRSLEAHRRVERVYAVFGWGPAPLAPADVELAFGLRYQETALLEEAPVDGRFSMQRLLAKAATSSLTLAQLASTLEKLAVFGVTGPRGDERYLGVTWSEATTTTSLPAPSGAEP